MLEAQLGVDIPTREEMSASRFPGGSTKRKTPSS